MWLLNCRSFAGSLTHTNFCLVIFSIFFSRESRAGSVRAAGKAEGNEKAHATKLAGPRAHARAGKLGHGPTRAQAGGRTGNLIGAAATGHPGWQRRLVRPKYGVWKSPFVCIAAIFPLILRALWFVSTCPTVELFCLLCWLIKIVSFHFCFVNILKCCILTKDKKSQPEDNEARSRPDAVFSKTLTRTAQETSINLDRLQRHLIPYRERCRLL
jgi:hypothetical protein